MQNNQKLEGDITIEARQPATKRIKIEGRSVSAESRCAL